MEEEEDPPEAGVVSQEEEEDSPAEEEEDLQEADSQVAEDLYKVIPTEDHRETD